MAALTTTFPFEIIESIVDILATEDDESFSSIKACSLVSHSLLPRARRYIFSSITVDGGCYNPALTREKFVRLIAQAPEIAHYVTSLYYTVSKSDSAVMGFATALGSLASLKSLTLSAYFIRWKDLPLREVILDLMHLPTLTHFSMRDNDGFCLSDLTLCTGLKSLEIVNLRHAARGEDNETYQVLPPRLERYVERDYNFPDGGLLTLLCTTRRTDGKPVVDISSLKQFSLYVKPEDCGAIQTLFTLCTQLTDVHLCESQQMLTKIGFANLFLHSIQTLQLIHMEFHIWQYASEHFLLRLASEFASLTGKNIIESIKISITVHFGAPHLYGDEWGALDRVFNYGWEKLRAFSIHIKVQYDPEDLSINVDELIADLLKLPEVQFRGLVRNEGILFDFDVSSQKSNMID